MNTEQMVHLAGNTDDNVFTVRPKPHYSPVCPQQSASLSIPLSPTHLTAPVSILLNHLTDPMTGKIILSAVSEDMQ
ncbi:hypothetical protein EDD16DRAFT_1720419 [Pisolithus croceorrhizus]|nr:hypothetical protein EDD16DRAFT_1720419 [Pisolithus croceorrhizus]